MMGIGFPSTRPFVASLAVGLLLMASCLVVAPCRAASEGVAATIERIDALLAAVKKVDPTPAPASYGSSSTASDEDGSSAYGDSSTSDGDSSTSDGDGDDSGDDGASGSGTEGNGGEETAASSAEGRCFVAGTEEKIETVHRIETELHAGFAACATGEDVEHLLAWAVGLPHRMERALGPFDYGPFLEILEKDALVRHTMIRHAALAKTLARVEGEARHLRGSFARKERYVKEVLGEHLHGEVDRARRLVSLIDRERGKLRARASSLEEHLGGIARKIGAKEQAAYARTEKKVERIRSYESSLHDGVEDWEKHFQETIHAHHLEGAASMLGRFAATDAEGNMFHPASVHVRGSNGFHQAILVNLLWPQGRTIHHLELTHPETGEGMGKVKHHAIRRHHLLTLQLGFTLKDVEWDDRPASQTFLAGLGVDIGRQSTLSLGWAQGVDEPDAHGFYVGVTMSLQRLGGMLR